MEGFDWANMATGPGDFLVCGTLLLVLKAVIGPYWTDLINRVATFVLATAIPPVATFALADIQGNVAPWWVLVLAGMQGVIVAGSLLGVNSIYRAKVKDDIMARFQGR